MVTGDADLLQLVDQGATVLLTRKGITQMDQFNAGAVKEKYGLEPPQMLDYKALTGDPSDNIPGVPGIGPKTASRLLQAYGTLENIYRAGDLGDKLKKNLEQYREQLFSGRELLILKCDLPLDFTWEECRFTGPDYHRLISLFSELEFKSLAERAKYSPAEKPGPAVAADKIPSIATLPQLNRLLEQVLPGDSFALLVHYTLTSRRQQKDPAAIALSTGSGPGYYLQKGLLDGQLPQVMQALSEACSRGATIVGHDIKPLYHLFYREGYFNPRFDFDTCLAAYLLQADQGGPDLSRLLNHRLGVIIDEPADDHEVGCCLARQAGYLLMLARLLKEQLEDQSLDTLYYRLELPLVETLAKMECRGIPVNLDLLDQLSGDIRKRIAGLRQRF